MSLPTRRRPMTEAPAAIVFQAQWKPDVGELTAGPRRAQCTRHHADNGIQRIIERDRASDHRAVCSEACAPQALAQQHLAPAARDFSGREQAAEQWANARERRERRLDATALEISWFARRPHRHLHRRVRLEVLEAVRARLPCPDHRRRWL